MADDRKNAVREQLRLALEEVKDLPGVAVVHVGTEQIAVTKSG